MKNKRVELLAPAGSPEGFYGAIHAGADAVYLGGAKFGARAYAENFTTEELVNCIHYAHLWGRRVYLTVNTLVKEKEFSQIYQYLLPFYEAGLDGVIVQDIGVFQYIGRCFPGLELHVSTQMTLTGEYGARMLKKMGASRIVPARELSLEEIRYLKLKSGLEIETFIHGAMCYCYSGQCLFSSILGGRSGNRGRCAQPCRLPYEVSAGGRLSGEAYPLSLKDMCTIDHIPELIEAGIDSFKIEGRMKKPEYTAGVTAIYRKVIDQYYMQPGKALQVEKEDREALSCLYIRSGRQDGYYFKHNGADMVTVDSPAYNGSDEALLQKIRSQYLGAKPVKRIQIYAEFTLGNPANVTILCGNLSCTVYGSVVEEAQKQPVTEENIRKQLTKTGDTIFQADTVEITLSSNAFYPLKMINELRRQAVVKLEKTMTAENGLCTERTAPWGSESDMHDNLSFYPSYSKKDNMEQETASLHITVKTKEQLKAVSGFLSTEQWDKISRLSIDMDILYGSTDEPLQEGIRQLSAKCEIFLALPAILRKRDSVYLERTWKALSLPGITGCLFRSPEGYGWLTERGYTGKLAADAGIYIWNKEALGFWHGKVSSYCLPLELNSREQKDLIRDDIQCEKIIYGRIPMMTTANCVARTAGQCLQEISGNKSAGMEKTVFLKDRYQKHFPVALNCVHCMNIIYNSVPLSLHGEMGKWNHRTGMRVDFTIENGKETRQLLAFFEALANGRNTIPLPFGEYTTGHEKRGVE